MAGPLEGIRIFDMTRILAGPTATQVLADLGADVIKVERPGTGDDVRGWGPPFLKTPDGEDARLDSVYFNAANRNKRSITLNLASEEGQALAKRLLAKCDVFFENYKTGDLAKYGLDYEQIKDEFPGLIYCSLSGFGHTGPYAPRPGFDLVVQAMGGLMSITGTAEQEPVKVGVAAADLMAGMYCNIGILAALRHRDRTGEGQHLDMSLLETQVAWLVNEGMNTLYTGVPSRAWGTAHVSICPYQAMPASDGHFILAVGTERQYRDLCTFLERPDLIEDPRFVTNADRVAHRAECVATFSEITRTQTIDWWIEKLAEVGVPCAPVNTIDKVFEDPQVKAREMVVELEHPVSGKAEKHIASPLNLSKTPPEYYRPSPTLGQHNEEVLGELLDIDAGEVRGLKERSVI
jgi:crotonobetainyl-CoA:carnitine CoA-transferase CaiB-like acyl-CoA transferase